MQSISQKTGPLVQSAEPETDKKDVAIIASFRLSDTKRHGSWRVQFLKVLDTQGFANFHHVGMKPAISNEQVIWP
jgi:hypothetical protein